MLRRQFLRNSLAGCGSFYLMGCGGGSADTAQSAEGLSLLKAPAPTPTPAPPPPPPVPTLRGVTIDAAEAEVKAPLAGYIDYFAKARTYQTDVVVRSPEELAAAVTAAHSDANLALDNRIVVAWDGLKSLAAGESARLNLGKGASKGHYASGGSLRIEAASGMKPAFANTIYVMGQGITFAGLTFVRRALAGEIAWQVYSIYAVKNATFPLEPILNFEKCRFGSPAEYGLTPLGAGADGSNVNDFTRGYASQGLATFVQMKECTFRGLEVAAHIVSRNTRVDLCDFRRLSGDAVDLFGHTFASGYYAHAWISRITVREAMDTWEARNKHIDSVQICTAADIHQGYRLLITDNILHTAHSFAGDPGAGGGSQGFFGSVNLNADNQWVLRRNVTLTTAPHGFCFWAPKTTRPSFVDRCVHTRAGRTPSMFPGETNGRTEDFAIGITGNTPSVSDTGNWLLVTNSIAANMFTGSGASMDIVEVDPRVGAVAAKRPESVFVGRDFQRGGASSNGMAGKFGYDLPSEKGTQAQFVADIWANFRNKDAASLYGIPNPTGLGWSL